MYRQKNTMFSKGIDRGVLLLPVAHSEIGVYKGKISHHGHTSHLKVELVQECEIIMYYQ